MNATTLTGAAAERAAAWESFLGSSCAASATYSSGNTLSSDVAGDADEAKLSDVVGDADVAKPSDLIVMQVMELV